MRKLRCNTMAAWINILLVTLAWQVFKCDACKEENNHHQSIERSFKVKSDDRFKSSTSTSNPFTLTMVQRSQAIFPPIVSRRQSTRPLFVPTEYKPISLDSNRQERIIIPIGVSHYRPVQYVDSFEHRPLPLSYFENLRYNRRNTSQVTTVIEPVISNSNGTLTASSDINEVKAPVNGGETIKAPIGNSGRGHPPRFIELESSYVPLTIRFPSRATKLNIIPGQNDLIGQDSTRHDSIGRHTTTPGKSSNNRMVNLDSRVLFGEEKREEPLVLKQDGKSNIPSNMQGIIKCIFPDFRFDGDDKIKSAC